MLAAGPACLSVSVLAVDHGGRPRFRPACSSTGLINNGIKSFVTDTWGEAAWAAVVQAAGVDHGFVSSCPYADAVSVS